MTDLQWEKLADERGGAPADGQGDLFEMTMPVVAPVEAPKPVEDKQPERPATETEWIEPRADWI